MTLRVETALDPTILDLPATELLSVLDGPTLFDLTLPDQDPMFVSVLLHGNEVSGWDAVRSILKEQRQKGQDTSMLLLVGNVEAASEGVRALDGQTDFNRIWEEERGKKFHWAEEVIERVSSKKPWFALDIHNNTCPNPHHAVITDMNPSTLSAARKFSKTAIFAMQPSEHSLAAVLAVLYSDYPRGWSSFRSNKRRPGQGLSQVLGGSGSSAGNSQ